MKESIVMIKCTKIISLLLYATISLASPKGHHALQSKTGNFALPPSQQPGPLFGIGQNILDKGICQIGGFFVQEKGKAKNFVDLAPSILYGLTNQLSLLLTSPINLHHSPQNRTNHGIQSIITQLEYAFYKKEKPKSITCTTLLGNVMFPTTSSRRFGFLLGATLSHTAINWYYFASPGAIFATQKHGAKDGNTYLFQCGVGRNIPSSPNIIALLMIELNSIFSQCDKSLGAKNPNSGGQVIYLGPTLWISTKKIFIQGGISFPIYEHLCGKQKKSDYLTVLNFGITL